MTTSTTALVTGASRGLGRSAAIHITNVSAAANVSNQTPIRQTPKWTSRTCKAGAVRIGPW